MKKYIGIILIFALIGTAFAQREIGRNNGETGLWKSLRVPGDTMADTLSLQYAAADSTILSAVFRTHSIASVGLRIVGDTDSVSIEKVKLLQWTEYRSPGLDDTNFVYISDMEWKTRSSNTGTMNIEDSGTYACNIMTASDPITALWYSRFEFVLTGDNKHLTGIKAILTVQTWDRP